MVETLRKKAKKSNMLRVIFSVIGVVILWTGKDCRFALVSLDADLFAPYWQGLSTFILAQIPVA